MPIQNITANFVPGSSIRRETMEDREYIVAPMVMITTGVHNGSNGALYYPENELSKTPEIWNQKPVVVYHPTENGVGVSACSESVISASKVGVVMNTKYENGKLHAEAWLEADRIEKIDPRVGEALIENKLMELSTGLFSDNEVEVGDFGGKEYTHRATNYRADHLALLPDKKGACSIADGAGFLQLNQSGDSTPPDFLIVNGRVFRPSVKEEKEAMEKEQLVADLIENAGTLWTAGDQEFLMNMEVDQLEKFIPKKIESLIQPAVSDPTEVQLAANAGAAAVAAPALVVNTTPVEVTAEQYVQNAPAEIRDMLNAGMASHAAERQRLVSTILANGENTFSEDRLKTMNLNDLQNIATLARPSDVQASAPPSFIGAATSNASPVKAMDMPEALVAPVMNWD